MKLKVGLFIAIILAAGYIISSHSTRPYDTGSQSKTASVAAALAPVNLTASAVPSDEAIMTPTLAAPAAAAPLLNLTSAPALTDAEKEAVRNYLIETNALAFPGPEIITLNILQARDGKPQPLVSTAAEILAKTQKLTDIAPPAALKEFHDSSIRNLAAYANLLNKIAKAGAPANMLTIMNSNELNQARLESQALINQLKALVTKNNIDLPSDVLPATPLPALNKQ